MRSVDVGQIPGYEEFAGRYIVYENSQVWSVAKNKFLTPRKCDTGYTIVDFYVGTKTSKHVKVHRLVALAFIPNPEGLPQVGHWDDDKDNNDISNLYWTEPMENNNHGSRNSKISKRVYCVELEREYPSLSAAARDLKINLGNLSSCLKGRQYTCGGYHWHYV